jgi:TPR repeat protein
MTAGVQDYVSAYMWFSLAAEHGDQAAIKRRDVIAQSLSPTQLAKAQKLAREWKPKSRPR